MRKKGEKITVLDKRAKNLGVLINMGIVAGKREKCNPGKGKGKM